ncbi:MAG: hypothetical protein OHK0035_30300 [Cyanobacteria bacterium J069]
MLWLFHNWLTLNRASAKAGFVLPTTVLLLLVVLLTVGSIGYRTYTRTVQTVGERQQRVVYNAATPTIDRAKAKVEYLFDPRRDPRFPSGIPSETWLLGMMLNTGAAVPGTTVTVPRHPSSQANPAFDPYTLPGETRIDIDEDGIVDNAWRYPTDTDGDGTNDATVAYSILYKTDLVNPQDTSDTAIRGSGANVGRANEGRARRLEVRNGPLSNNSSQNNACSTGAAAASADGVGRGWLPDGNNTSLLRKNFQADVYVQPNTPNRPVAALEFQQDRTVEQGNKWGAWFRNDLEIFPGPPFNWNGAMHSEGNIFIGGGSFRSYLISSRFSCLYSADASEVSTVETDTFKGQFLAASLRDNASGAGDRADFDLYNGYGINPTVGNLNNTTHSVNLGTTEVEAYALDPVILQTEARSASRRLANPTASRPGWPGTALNQNGQGRLIQPPQENPPYVDDSYRADDRYGPKPTYGGREDDPATSIPGLIGEQIPTTSSRLVGNTPGVGQDDSAVGLDGYWERRARNEGMRVLVGQRLELGNAAGWGGPFPDATANNEPLKPWPGCIPENANRCNEARQRRSLYDNLPAVQAAAIYHRSSAETSADRDRPAACLALTVHPGTAGTLDRSATFENLALNIQAGFAAPYNTPGTVISDFLRGRGTNGWEYNLPPANAFNALNTPTMQALQNLANFAGDPRGGAPSFTPVQDNQVHPYPWFSMWGDFSMLRRVIARMAGGTTFANLSPADKSTLYTSACTMGMLAYQLDYLEKFDANAAGIPLGTDYATQVDENNAFANPALSAQFYAGLRGVIRALDRGVSPFGPIKAANSNDFGIMVADRGSIERPRSPETIIRLMQQWRDQILASGTPYSFPNSGGTLTAAQLNDYIRLAQMIISKEQVARDRQWGFFGYESLSNSAETYASRAPVGAVQVAGFYGASKTCREMWLNNGSQSGDPIKFLCSNRPFYPALYNLFPTLGGAVDSGTGAHPDAAGPLEDGGGNVARDQADAANDAYLLARNSGVTYQPVLPEAVRLLPRPPANWVLPFENLAAAPAGSDTEFTPNNNRDTLIKFCITDNCSRYSLGGNPNTGTFRRVGFKDAALMNGRELLSVRVLDVNLDLLRRAGNGLTSDRWLPATGIVYAFREDAISEATVVRPTPADWTSCNTEQNLRTEATCRMQTATVTAFNSTDPPLNENNGVTPKPVDYYADPDRRPNGFRLKNGSRLDRPGDNGRGLSFISDNPVYIQGNFNLHQNTAGTELQEFTTLLTYDGGQRYANFYNRTLANIDNNFARAGDLWRPSEVLADAITILSDNSCDGSMQDVFLTLATNETATLANARNGAQVGATSARYGCQGNGNRTTYLNFPRPSDAGSAPAFATGTTTAAPNTLDVVRDESNNPAARWMRTNYADSMFRTLATAPLKPEEGDSPIIVNRNGAGLRPILGIGSTNRNYRGAYYPIAANRSLITALPNTRVNSIIISGLVPSRANQSYGGLHNFPRFNEDWTNNSPLFISGSLLQLSFSQQATAPFDQDAWEVGTNPVANEAIRYYVPPLRRWGYDVGLQLAPAGPIAQRFVTVRSIRSEFYSEPPANDAYIRQLCRAIQGALPAANRRQCPA